jgi:K+-sensing histidine kinase KdpD
LIETLNDASDRNQVEFTHASESIDIHIDRRLFKRVFINLMHNAFVHNPQGVLVKVHMEDQDTEYVKIILEDNGVGIPEEELKTIFTRYYRGSHTKLKTEGSGLGLAISKDIVEAHKGHISAKNSRLGGLKITIHLRRDIDETLS